MTLGSQVGGERHVVDAPSGASFPLTTATTVFNVLQALTNSTSGSASGNDHAYGVMMDVAMALLILAFGRYAHRLLTETWPRWNLEQLRKFLALDTADDAAAVDVFKNQPEEFVFDNELLVLSLERYVSYLAQFENRAQQGDGAAENANSDRPAKVSSRFVQQAQYCYSPSTLLKASRSISAAEMLRDHHALFMLPADGIPTEVEPGLTVCFQKQLVKVSTLREGKIVPRCGGRSVMEAFIPLNFDAFPVCPASKRIRNAEHNGVTHGGGTDGEDDDLESLGEAEQGSNATGSNGNMEDVLVHQAILQCTDKNEKGKERIMDFARRAYAWYTKNAVESVERFCFLSSASELHRTLGLCAKLPSGAVHHCPMRRFALPSGGRSFHNLFFQQKAELLALLEEFKQKQGKFALPGVAHQLVILLHGIPGTGKSTIVRNIAAFLDRHIVSLPIEHIQTDSALRGILSGAVVISDGAVWKKDADTDSMRYAGLAYLPSQAQRLDVSTVVYLFEDVEAISDLLSFQLPLKHQHWPTGPKDEREKKEEEGDKGSTGVGAKREETNSADASGNHAGGDSFTTDSESQEEASACRVAASPLEKCRRLLAADFLSPDGVLTALNATLAPPGRVIVFTTSHPEKLPALFWKPGVVTLTVHLDILNATSAMEVVDHYCGASLTPSLRTRLEMLFAECEARAATAVMNPASLLHLLTVCDDAEELLRELERFC